MARAGSILGLGRAVVAATALFALGSLLPLVGGLLVMAAPAPLLLEVLGRPYARVRMWTGLALLAVLVVALGGLVQGAGFILTLGLAAGLMFEMLERETPFEAIVLACSATMLVGAVLGMLLLAGGSPAAMVKNVQDALTQAMAHADKFYQQLGLNLSDSKELNARVLGMTLSLVPALAALTAGLATLLNLGLLWHWAQPRLGYALFGSLARWRTPEWFIWFLLATGFGLFMPNAPFKLAATNGFVLVAAIYFCQGLAIMAYYFQKLAMPVVARGMIYMIALVQPVLAAVVCLAGIFDLWIDFRRLKPPSPEAGSFDDFF